MAILIAAEALELLEQFQRMNEAEVRKYTATHKKEIADVLMDALNNCFVPYMTLILILSRNLTGN